ncbi:unnamed protein product, partial [Ectocarpus fasciculatus]
DQVLVRLKVEHSDFPTLNNQRFGSQFMGKVANPSDLLLFYRRRNAGGGAAEGPALGEGKSSHSRGLSNPIRPDDLADIRVEDLVAENLENADKKLSLLVEPKLKMALEDYVYNQNAQAVADMVKEALEDMQEALWKERSAGTAAMIDDAISKRNEKERGELEAERVRNAERDKGKGRRGATASAAAVSDDDEEEEDDMEEMTEMMVKSPGARGTARGRSKGLQAATIDLAGDSDKNNDNDDCDQPRSETSPNKLGAASSGGRGSRAAAPAAASTATGSRGRAWYEEAARKGEQALVAGLVAAVAERRKQLSIAASHHEQEQQQHQQQQTGSLKGRASLHPVARSCEVKSEASAPTGSEDRHNVMDYWDDSSEREEVAPTRSKRAIEIDDGDDGDGDGDG